MSNPTAEPPLAPPQAPPAAPPPRRRRWIALVVVGVAALLVGAGIATVTVLSVATRPEQHRYAVAVFLTHDATSSQKDAIRTALKALHPVDGIRFETREQAYQRFKEQFKDDPNLVNGTRPDSLPESYRLTTSGTNFDCSAFTKIRHLPGVDDATVVQTATHAHPGAVIQC
jgi:cell division protein FtsX